MSLQIIKVETKPFDGQKPGTSGLRKKVKEVTNGNYLKNFIQAIFSALPRDEVEGSTLLISGDGRYYNKEAICIATSIAFANGVKRVWVGREGLMSTPAASAVIREREGGVAIGGIVLTASHNPGGPENDFGIKYNGRNGGPAPESMTDKIYEETKTIQQFLITEPIIRPDLSKVGIQSFGGRTVEIIDPVEDWMNLMRKIFDFPMLHKLVKRPDFSMIYDGLHGVAGPYAKAVLCEELGLPASCLSGCEPKEDFGGGHPDPNLTYAHDLVEAMGIFTPEKAASCPQFGAAGDGDCDRNMILGRGFFVTPSDSVAVIASYAVACIPYFKDGLKGLSRSLPTSAALDSVAQAAKVNIYEVPTGWKFFGNLMDAGKLSICGEESFGTGSDHIREKDGLWAVLAWLSILAYRNGDASKPFVSVEQIVTEFWTKYGRNYYSRYDYEEVDSSDAQKVMDHLTGQMGKENQTPNLTGLSSELQSAVAAMKVKYMDNFNYTDPVDGSVSKNQGIRLGFENGSRIIWRLSGTGSVGATIRVYFEKPETSKDQLGQPTATALKDLINIAAEVSQLKRLTGREKPTVIT